MNNPKEQEEKEKEGEGIGMGAFLAFLGTALAAGLSYWGGVEKQKKIDELNQMTMDFEEKKLGQQKELTEGGLDIQQGQLDLQSDIFKFKQEESALDREERREETIYGRNKEKAQAGLTLLNANVGMRDRWMNMWKNVGGFSALGGKNA